MATGDLAGMVALVTGAAQGIGEATAASLADRGASLVMTDIRVDRLAVVAERLGTRVPVSTVVADLTDPSGPERVITETLAAMGRVDMLASVAGLAERATILDTSVELWDQMQHLNVRAHFQLIQGVARHLVERDAPGSIVCAGSLNAHGGQPDLCAYSVAKGGLLTLVRHAAHALLPHRIRVNIVNFGWMHTPGEVEIQASAHGHDESWLDQAGAALPFGRLIQPAEAARLLTFLATPDSGVMTGASIDYSQSVPGSGPTTMPRADFLSL